MRSRTLLAQKDGRTLRNMRHVAGLTQGDLARRVELSRAAIAKYEGGSRRMSAEIRLRLLQALAGETDPPEAA
jgi:transcriptional regulator with XRE-family HTH domain